MGCVAPAKWKISALLPIAVADNRDPDTSKMYFSDHPSTGLKAA